MSFLSKLFKTDKRDTSFNGPRPYGSLLEAEGGKDYYNTIQGRLQGQGVGYGSEYASQAANPVIARMRNQFTGYDLPELQSQLSATGRRKSSGGFDQLRRAYTDQSLAEGDVYSGLYQQNEAQKRTEINDALARLGEFNKGDYDARTNASDFYYKDNQRQVSEEDKRRDNVRDLRMRGIGSAMMFIPGAQGMSGGMSQGYQPQYNPQQVNQAMQQPAYYNRLKLSPYTYNTRIK